MSDERPATSRARGVCRYYRTPRGCFAGRNCKFLHGEGETLTPFDKNKTCRYFANGYCKRGDKCWFRHVLPPADSTAPNPDAVDVREQQNEEEDEDLMCSICYEKPVTFGLLGWRDPADKDEELIYSGNTKKCPTCRAPSRFVTPSSIFYSADHPRKAQIVAQYKATMAQIPCKYFERSLPGHRFCPFGKDCFYQHLNEDGTPFVFKRGMMYYLRRKPQYERRLLSSLLHEHSRPFIEHINAAINSILDGTPTNVNAPGPSVTNDWRDLELSTSLLAGLADDTTFSLIEDVGMGTYAQEMMSIFGPLLPRLESVVGPLVLNRDGIREATTDPPTFMAPVDDPEEGEAYVESDPPTEEDSGDDPLISAEPLEWVVESTGNAEEATATEVQETETPAEEHHEVPEPPFLTDGRGRVVWSNTKNNPGSTSGSLA
ncbi:hypothetical protein NM688_g7525 [Phlebia brevispora]|uniref:Uncharacterized protein n=1 Tax=Phlebia brevispora TaxID=194682 RepID=A0ACC1S4T7_9APHY|nr:hypothetical protein NM688_g7525 [Phlebia brevispora]